MIIDHSNNHWDKSLLFKANTVLPISYQPERKQEALRPVRPTPPAEISTKCHQFMF